MAIDIAKIRANLNRLDPASRSSNSNGGNDRMWKPDSGEGSTTYGVRFVPYKFDAGNPFREFYWHYSIGGKHFLCPKYHGEGSCPVCDFASTVWKEFTESGDENLKEMFKKLMPKLRVYAPVIVRGLEDEGIKIYTISEGAYKQIMNKLVSCYDEGVDITDPSEGLDFKITAISKKIKKPYGAIEVESAIKCTPLFADMTKIDEVLDDCPEIDPMFTPKPMSEVQKALNDHANVGETEPDSTVGSVKNPPQNTSSQTPVKQTPKDELEAEMDSIFSGSADTDDLPFK